MVAPALQLVVNTLATETSAKTQPTIREARWSWFVGWSSGVRQLRGDVDGVPNAASHRAVVGVEAVGPFRLLAGFVAVDAFEGVRHMDPFDDEDLAVLFDLADRFRYEVSVACVNATRLQRAP